MSNINKLLDQYNINYLYHITQIENVSSIIKYGLLSRNKIREKKICFKDIADQCVVNKEPELHNYVRLFFATHTPMQYIVENKFGSEKIVIISFNALLVFIWKKKILQFSDGNAACNKTKFYSNIEDLDKLDWRLINKVKKAYSPEYKRKKSAEVLIKDKIEQMYISNIFCCNQRAKMELLILLKDYNEFVDKIVVNKSLFYNNNITNSYNYKHLW